MKILVMAQTPPPMHGQSRMVQLFLDSLSGVKSEFEVIHLNFKFSGSVGEIGRFQLNKCFSLLRYFYKMVWIRYKCAPEVFYYVPAPAQRIPLLRDYITLLLARRFFPRVIFHWHAVGVGQWSQHRAKQGARERVDQCLCNACYGDADLSIALSESTRTDAEVFRPQKMVVIHNGIPDPCPDFDKTLLPIRLRKQLKIKTNMESNFGENGNEKITLRILFISLCTKPKGLFDALRALEIIAQSLNNNRKNIYIQFDVAGSFPEPKVEEKFLQNIQKQKYITVKMHGFVSGKKKDTLFRKADAMVYPSYYENEGFPLILIEALAYGLPVVASRWRGIPELLDNDYPFLTIQKNIESINEKFHLMLIKANSLKLRKRFEQRFTEAVFKNRILDILRAINIE